LYNKKLTKITVIGKDKKGVVANFAMYLFQNGVNIEDLDQNVLRGVFSMTMHADATSLKIDRERFIKELGEIAAKLKMEVKVRFPGQVTRPSMAILVTTEAHCLETLLSAWKDGELDVDIPCIIGNKLDLKSFAEENGIPFFLFDNPVRKENEIEMLKKLDELEVDFLVLARFMKILSPEFVWRYENRIINIHPSLLPAFPGAMAYRQAHEKGVRIAGVTSHFVTMDLDQGPIIVQESFNITPNMSLDEIKDKGQKLEAKVLLKGVKLYLKGKLKIHWGKVFEE